VRLTGYRPPTWRLRVGDWRVFFHFATETNGEEQRLLVRRVLHRREAYR
jgi:mRNA-degrading endonuclease RelE of RelBE toxin-antitoxin system